MPTASEARPNTPSPILLALAYLGFISLGLPDTVVGVVWPSARGEFSVSQAALGAALASVAATSFVSGLLAGHLVRRLGVGLLLAASTGLVAMGVAGYAAAPGFGFFLFAAGLVGFGSGAVDAGLNAYAARFFAPRHMSWLHAAYSVGAALGPALMTAVVSQQLGWRAGYAIIAVILAGLASVFFLVRGRWEQALEAGVARREPESAASSGSAWQAIRSGGVRAQAVLFFLYSGVEIGAGQWSYTLLVESRGLTPGVAGSWVTGYWASILAGRVLSGFVVERVGQTALLRGCSVLAVGGSVLFALPGVPPTAAGCGLVALGLALAPIYPGMMSETARRIGPALAPYAFGFQVSAATLGVAVLPSAAGLAGAWMGLGWTAGVIALFAVLWTAGHEWLVARIG